MTGKLNQQPSFSLLFDPPTYTSPRCEESLEPEAFTGQLVPETVVSFAVLQLRQFALGQYPAARAFVHAHAHLHKHKHTQEHMRKRTCASASPSADIGFWDAEW